MITSVQNPKIQWVRSLQADSRARRQEKTFVVEGVRLIEEAITAGWEARLVLHTEDLSERGLAVLKGYAAQGAPLEQITSQVMRSASDTETPQGILAVLAWRSLPLPAPLDFVLIPDTVRDPGNLGAMLRAAASAGVQAAFIPPETVDAFSPKVLRAGMGAHFRLPIRSTKWEEIVALVEPLKVFLPAAGEGVIYTGADFRVPLALIVGGEAEGASPQAQRLATRRVHIPMPGGGESLNAAVATGVLLFEVVRQRSDTS